LQFCHSDNCFARQSKIGCPPAATRCRRY
jgi:hypothetical protein